MFFLLFHQHADIIQNKEKELKLEDCFMNGVSWGLIFKPLVPGGNQDFQFYQNDA